MEHMTIGRTDLRVSSVCLASMTFGEQVDAAGVRAIVDPAIGRGIAFSDPVP